MRGGELGCTCTMYKAKYMEMEKEMEMEMEKPSSGLVRAEELAGHPLAGDALVQLVQSGARGGPEEPQ